MNKTLDATVLRYLGYGLLAVGVLMLGYLVRGALPVFFAGGLIAYALEPVLRNLERRGWSRRGSVGFVFLVFVLLFLLALAVLASAFQQVLQLNVNVGTLVSNGQKLFDTMQGRLERMPFPPAAKKTILESTQNLQDQVSGRIPGLLQGGIGFVTSSIGAIAIYMIVLPIITLWLMMEANPIRARLLMLIPPQYRRDATTLTSSINELLGRYVRGQIIVCGLFGFACTLTFMALSHFYGMSYPLVLGLAAGFLYIVPYIGMATVAASAGLIGYFTTNNSMPCALIAVGSCVAYNLILDYGVSPRVLGQGVGLHPLMVIFALLCGNQLGGPIGMILSVPFFAALRVIAIHLFPQLSAPIPQTSPESQNSTPEDATREVVRQTVEAEHSVESPLLAVSNATASAASHQKSPPEPKVTGGVAAPPPTVASQTVVSSAPVTQAATPPATSPNVPSNVPAPSVAPTVVKVVRARE